MPIYEYRCTQNGHRFEVIQKVDDPPLTECRMCSSPVHKLISRSSFILKGSGFYKNDYAPKSASSVRDEGGAGDKDAGGKGDKKEKETKSSKSLDTGAEKAAASS